MIIMKKVILIMVTIILTSIPVFADYKPIPKNLNEQYKKEVTKIIDTQYPVAVRETKQIRRKAHKMYLKVLKDNSLYMDYVTNNFDINISIGEFNLLSKIIDLTDKYVKIKDDTALATDYNGAILDFLNPYFKDNKIETKKLDNLGILVNTKYKEIVEEQNILYGPYKLQQLYEEAKSSKYKDFEKYSAAEIVQQDLKNYHCCRKSMYGLVMYLIEQADETNHRFLLQIKKNFDDCSKNLKCWKYIKIDNYNYSWVNDATRNTIWFNNMVFLNK